MGSLIVVDSNRHTKLCQGPELAFLERTSKSFAAAPSRSLFVQKLFKRTHDRKITYLYRDHTRIHAQTDRRTHSTHRALVWMRTPNPHKKQPPPHTYTQTYIGDTYKVHTHFTRPSQLFSTYICKNSKKMLRFTKRLKDAQLFPGRAIDRHIVRGIQQVADE